MKNSVHSSDTTGYISTYCFLNALVIESLSKPIRTDIAYTFHEE